MLYLTTGLLALLGVAMLSVLAAYRWSGSTAWQTAYNKNGMGLAIEMVFAVLLYFAVLTVAVIMSEAFEVLFLRGGWRSAWYLGAAGVMGGGVLIYMNIFAPGILSREQKVESLSVRSQCRLPYFLYSPYSLIIWVALILPLVAMVYSSIRLDHVIMNETIQELTMHSEMITASAEEAGDLDLHSLAYFHLEYQESISIVKVIVNRYLWVVGTFMVFLIIMLNTRITTIFTKEAQDYFKWIMWLLLMVAIGIGLFGVQRFHLLRSLTIDTFGRVFIVLQSSSSMEMMLTAKEHLLTIQAEGTMTFLRQILEGGSLWLLFFSYVTQIVLAKVTNRSVLKIIFPSNIARFLDSFLQVEDKS